MDLQESVRKQNGILWRVYKHVINTTAGKTSNLVISPALINVILSFIAAYKSPGATEEQILSLLKASSTDELNAVSSQIVTTVLADSTTSGGPMISTANGFWIEKSLCCVEQSFKNLLETSYKAAFKQVDFRTKADEVSEEVNTWVEKQTNGLITGLLPGPAYKGGQAVRPPGSEPVSPVWDEEFDPSLTKDSDFHLLDGTKVPVPFMSGDFFSYHLDVYPGFKVLNLPYREGRRDGRSFSMQIYLPDEKEGLPAMLEMLASTPEDEDEDIPSYRADIGELKIPKFKFGFHFEATEALKSLGLSLPLETIFHKSCIEVDEVGSKAAAAAAVVGEGCCGPAEKKYEFVADHPFLFLVKEHGSGVVLFLGQVLDPSMH
ncbi:hypothetical protein IGI04_010402 [Brassica rapa subsp. trilocularis]|uniref:Serpin domain-containing protein n=1 Tax=Brassica rapa subsp. trilocularis TaxID=1813537 RepID=A0ABQ7N026_BRACM|nr:hypothetical protein IGI04_010402 [Brassica rapa subsp. trilocularis]